VTLDDATPERLRAVEEQARDLGIVCLYGAMHPAEPGCEYAVQEHGFRLVEVAVTMSRSGDLPFEAPDTPATVRLGTPDDLPALADSVARLSRWSRFGADPRFGPEAARRMHDAWVARAASPDSDEWSLIVAEEAGEITGFSTHVQSPDPRIDLMAVTRPGTAVSWALMAYAVDWAAGRTLYGGPIAARNLAPLRFTEHCGFTISHVRYLFHRWLDEHTPRGGAG
jgi:hypothetical protein